MNYEMMRQKTAIIVFRCFAALCGIVAALWVYHRPLIGDDLFYASDLEARGGGILALPHLMAGIWTGCNGRLGDITNTVWLSILPRAVTALFAFAFTVLLPWAAVKLSGLRLSQAMPVALLTAAIVFLMPWWDMSHLVCLINYPWGAAIVLVCLIPLTDNRRPHNRLWYLALPVAAAAAAWHEATGVPLVVALLCRCMVRGVWKEYTTVQKWWCVAMIAGGLFTVSSPAIWQRAAAGGEPDGSVVYLLATSANLSVILLSAIIAMAFINRDLLRRLIHDSFLLFAVASIVSTCIVIAGGVEGRSGFYSQIFAAIALTRIFVVATGNRNLFNRPIAVYTSVLFYVLAIIYVAYSYRQDLKETETIEQAIAVYPDDHERGYEIVMSLPAMEVWDAASLKTLDPRYDPKLDRNASFTLHAEEP